MPLIVAINKIDKSDADPSRVKNDLLAHDVVAEDFGGDTQMVELSAKTGQGVDDLLDAISPAGRSARPAGGARRPRHRRGHRIRARQGPRPGRDGAGAAGHAVARATTWSAASQYGRVRALFDETGSQVPRRRSVDPGAGARPVRRAGCRRRFRGRRRRAPGQGRRPAARRQAPRDRAWSRQAGNRMEDIMAQMGEGASQQSLNLVVKADVQGSVQALREALTGAVQRADPHQRDRLRRGRHHRVRRPAGGDLEGHRHRLQRARRRLGAQGDREPTASTCATSRSSTT